MTYDRDGTSIALEDAAAYDFDSAFAGAGWLHITGITPAISQAAAGAALEAVQTASRAGLTVSCDLNFRKKLWNWQKHGLLSPGTINSILMLLPKCPAGWPYWGFFGNPTICFWLQTQTVTSL